MDERPMDDVCVCRLLPPGGEGRLVSREGGVRRGWLLCEAVVRNSAALKLAKRSRVKTLGSEGFNFHMPWTSWRE